MSAILTPISEAEAFDRGQVAQLRVPPHSIAAESSVLGGLLLDARAWDAVGDILTDADFYRHEHRLVFVAIGGLVNANKPCDVVSVYAALESIGKGDEVGGLAYLNSLAQFVPSAGNIRRYAQIVRERGILRRLVSAADEIASSAFNTQGRAVETILDDAMRRVMEISPDVAEEDWVSMDAIVVQQLDRIQVLADNPAAESGTEFTPTGFDNFDDLLDGGLRAGQFVVIGGRPSHGKSAIADAISYHIAGAEGKPVAKFSMEMQNAENGQRALANVGGIPLYALRRPSRMTDLDWQALTKGVDILRQVRLYSHDKGGLNINQVRAKARALARRVGKLGAIVVDYFQLMSGVNPRDMRSEQLAEASRGLKSLGKELECPVIALAQINRSVEKQGEAWEKQIPTFADLKDCGSLEQDADIILFMIRPSIAQKSLDKEWTHYARGELAKQRSGRTGSLHFLWEGMYTRYSAWPETAQMPVTIRASGGGSRL